MSYADIKLVADMDASNHSAGLPSSHNRMVNSLTLPHET